MASNSDSDSGIATTQWQAAGFYGPWLAPAKLNLMLRIIGRRPDGYHNLQTVFQFIDACDRLYFRPRPDGQITRDHGPAAVPAAQDLTVRAARLLQAHTGCRLGVDIRIDKRLPLGGGLGGGSSDAATTLVALNRLWRLGLDPTLLAVLGLRLGADVPVFVSGRAAWAEGVGEQLTPVELPQPWYLILMPPCQVSTAAVFNTPELTRHSLTIKMRDFLAGDAVNDCLPVVRANYPLVAAGLDWLNEHGRGRLTGTGACVFASYATEAQAQELAATVPAGFAALVAPGRNYSPLFANLADMDATS